jgi:hypothetical protein
MSYTKKDYPWISPAIKVSTDQDGMATTLNGALKPGIVFEYSVPGWPVATLVRGCIDTFFGFDGKTTDNLVAEAPVGQTPEGLESFALG